MKMNPWTLLIGVPVAAALMFYGGYLFRDNQIQRVTVVKVDDDWTCLMAKWGTSFHCYERHEHNEPAESSKPAPAEQKK